MYTRVSAIVFKEFGHMLADYQTLSLLLLIPALELPLFGYAINTVVDHVAMVVFDEAGVSLT
jgi:ABC-2 type transport system permease protein